MTYAAPQSFDPRILAALRNLPLAARTAVDGFMFGVHPSRIPGPGGGLEFSQYRSYQPGDDLRHIDWKLFGRSDRYFVRQSEIETSVTVRLVVDASASMSAEDDGLSLFDYARLLAAALALLAHRQGDAVGLTAVAGDTIRSLPPRRHQQDLQRLFYTLEQVTPAGAWPPWQRLEAHLASGVRGLTVVISDLHERGDEIRAAAARLAALRHEVLVLHVTTRREAEFDYTGPVVFEELETGHRIEVDAEAVRDEYLRGLDRAWRDLSRAIQEIPAAYHRFRADEPLAEALRGFLQQRARSSRER